MLQRLNEIVRYEPCPHCRDGSCGSCGLRSSKRAGPGVRLVRRRFRFVRCGCSGGCSACGPRSHPEADPGVKIEYVGDRVAGPEPNRVHLAEASGANGRLCGRATGEGTHDRARVNCGLCLARLRMRDLR